MQKNMWLSLGLGVLAITGVACAQGSAGGSVGGAGTSGAASGGTGMDSSSSSAAGSQAVGANGTGSASLDGTSSNPSDPQRTTDAGANDLSSGSRSDRSGVVGASIRDDAAPSIASGRSADLSDDALSSQKLSAGESESRADRRGSARSEKHAKHDHKSGRSLDHGQK